MGSGLVHGGRHPTAEQALPVLELYLYFDYQAKPSLTILRLRPWWSMAR